MIRTLLILILLVVGFAVAFAPAALLRHAIPSGGGIGLTALSGTLWDGSADLVLGGIEAGRVEWRFTPVTILQGALGYHLALSAPGQALSGELRWRPSGIETVLDGTVQGAYVNAWLDRYDIELSGDFGLRSMRLVFPREFDPGAAPDGATGSAAGFMTWSGGPVRYRLAGEDFSGALPPLEARFGERLEAVVQAAGNATPLLRVELLENGYVRLGMTRLLTRMLNNPWPGADADHEVVLEIEERLL